MFYLGGDIEKYLKEKELYLTDALEAGFCDFSSKEL